jgi:hypothetical protein
MLGLGLVSIVLWVIDRRRKDRDVALSGYGQDYLQAMRVFLPIIGAVLIAGGVYTLVSSVFG